MQYLKFKNLWWILIKKLSNLNITILILFIIIFFSILGSIIEQDQKISFYQNNYPMNSNSLFFISWRFILSLGLDHVYQTWWFISILAIFSICLISCTFTVQFPSLKNARRWKFKKIIVENECNLDILQYKVAFDNKRIAINNMLYSLSYHGYYIFNKDKSIYAYKGLLGRLAPIFVHISIIITLLGACTSILNSFIAQEMVPNGELFHLKNIIHAGNYSYMNRTFLGRVNDFYIEYNSDNSIKQFFSEIVLFNHNYRNLIRSTISVNKPLLFQDFTIYQTNWNIDALRISIDDNYYLQLKLQEIEINNKKCWLSNFFISNDIRFYFILFNLKDTIYIYDVDHDNMYPILLNQKISIDNSEVAITDIIASTGLQIKVDHGVSIIYFGFFFVMISTLASYISYSQIWIDINSNSLRVLGSTNRAVLFFEEDITKIHNLYQAYHIKS